MGTGSVQGSLPSTAFLSFPPSAEDPRGSLAAGECEGRERGGRWPGKGVGQRPQAAAANTSVFPFLQGKSGHLLSPIPVLIIGDPKSALNRANGILFSLCQNITFNYLEQIHRFLV